METTVYDRDPGTVRGMDRHRLPPQSLPYPSVVGGLPSLGVEQDLPSHEPVPRHVQSELEETPVRHEGPPEEVVESYHGPHSVVE